MLRTITSHLYLVWILRLSDLINGCQSSHKVCLFSPVLSVGLIKDITSSTNLVSFVSHNVIAMATLKMYSQSTQK